jgi:hypothetical protein
MSTNTFSMAFDSYAKIVEKNANLVVGENGSNAQASAANSTLDFNGKLSELFLLMRGSDKQLIYTILDDLKSICDSNLLDSNKRNEYLIQLLKVVLFLRQPRKGKGEKMLFYVCVEYLYEAGGSYKILAETAIKLCGDFGYYKDLNQMWKLFTSFGAKDFILNYYVQILANDFEKKDNFTLAAKWAPREGSSFDAMAKVLATKLYDKLNVTDIHYLSYSPKLRFYRKFLSNLNKKLNVTQPYMCQKHWADIDFSLVPSVAMTQLTKAFQDEKVNPFPKSKRLVKRVRRGGRVVSLNVDTRRHLETDTDYADRQKCRENLFEHIKSGKKINATVTQLSDIIQNYLAMKELDVVWEAQWEARIKEIREMVEKLPEHPSIFPLVDLSSSMSGSPMINAITLGLFTATILDTNFSEPENPFANRFMSFETTPRLVKLPRVSQFDETKPATLKEKMEIMKQWTGSGCWGGSTNIHAAIKLLLTIATDNKVDPKSMPKILAIFSDMQFDQGDSTWGQTSYIQITQQFKDAGYEVPHIIFWNLRGDTRGYQVKADKPNSTMLSGYSTRMLDLFLSGNVDELNKENNVDEKTLQERNTLSMLEKVLNHDMFKPYKEMFGSLFV